MMRLKASSSHTRVVVVKNKFPEKGRHMNTFAFNRATKIMLGLYIAVFSPLTIAEDITGKWCENGGPYTCYPPIDNKTSTYTCIDSTSITNADEHRLDWITTQTIHYYSNGFKNGKSKPGEEVLTFKRIGTAPTMRYQHVEENRDVRRLWQLQIQQSSMEMIYEQIPNSAEIPVIHRKTIYQRCNSDPDTTRFYTALVDCDGSGNYIAGVPAVIDNPLLWDLGENNISKSNCRIAARCWGGGWVAYAASNADETNKAAFGAACGSESRHDAKQQAINSCRLSGGTNCLNIVVSGFDGGDNDLKDTRHKGSKVETCRYGDCKIVSRR